MEPFNPPEAGVYKFFKENDNWDSWYRKFDGQNWHGGYNNKRDSIGYDDILNYADLSDRFFGVVKVIRVCDLEGRHCNEVVCSPGTKFIPQQLGLFDD